MADLVGWPALCCPL